MVASGARKRRPGLKQSAGALRVLSNHGKGGGVLTRGNLVQHKGQSACGRITISKCSLPQGPTLSRNFGFES